MYDRHNILLRFRNGLHEKVKERAAEKGISINEWLNRAIEFALLQEEAELVETRKVTL